MATFTCTANVIQPKGKLVYEYNPLYNYRKNYDAEAIKTAGQDPNGAISDLITTGSDQLNFNLEHPVDIVCQNSYDGSTNLILNDGLNQPRLINTRFTVRENNTYERVDRLGNTDTNLYDQNEFEIDSSLLKKYINIPKLQFSGVYHGGSLPVGMYTFYFKLSDADGNETDIVAESGLVAVHMGALNNPGSIRGGQANENSGKSVQFRLYNLDSGYDYVSVYYTRATGVENNPKTVQAIQVLSRYRVRQSTCQITVNGEEQFKEIPISDIVQNYFMVSAAKTQAICQNMLFMGNVSKYVPNFEEFSKVSLGFVPYYTSEAAESGILANLRETYLGGGYYNTKNIYNKVGYWNEEIYRIGVVYVLKNGSLSPVYNIRGCNNLPKYGLGVEYDDWKELTIDYDTQLINSGKSLENSAGVIRINDTDPEGEEYFQIRGLVIKPQDADVIAELKKLGVKGYFFVRQKRIPTILCQGFMLGQDTYSGIPAWKVGGSEESGWITESFITDRGQLTHDYADRLITLTASKTQNNIALCPEYELNQGYFNNLFTGSAMPIKQETTEQVLRGNENHFYTTDTYKKSDKSFTQANVVSVPDGALIVDGSNKFRNIAGKAEDISYTCISSKSVPIKKNFANTTSKKVVSYLNGHLTVDKIDEEHQSKVKMVRGLYGTYLGIYKQKTLDTNSVINIYIPGYNAGRMDDYFKIRIDCEDPYYTISERISLGSETEHHVYRGDCYISQFTHRMNRNFQDPNAPNNDVIIDESTWVDNYKDEDKLASEVNRGDLNAVRIGTYITFRCYTSMNVALRDFDRSYPAEEALTGSKRSFYPLTNLRVDGHYKLPESTMYNQGFSSSTGERYHFAQPAVPYIKNNFETRIIYSDVAQSDAFKNGFRVYRNMSFQDYSNEYGGITKIVEWAGNLIVIFEHAIGLLAVNQDSLIPTDDGTKIAVGAVKVIKNTMQMISTDYGSQWKDSICASKKYLYGIDTVAKKIWRTNGSTIECISDFKVQKFLNDNITLGERVLSPIIGVRNVKTHYNAYKDDVMFTYYDNVYGFEEKVWNLCYNELQAAFTTFYSWVPSYSANIDNIYFSFDRNSSKWLAKLAMTKANANVSQGVTLSSVNLDDAVTGIELSLSKRLLPEQYELTFMLQRDTWGNYEHFTINGNTLKVKDKSAFLAHWFTTVNAYNQAVLRDPIIPVVQLNIKCEVTCTLDNAAAINDKTNWENYMKYTQGMYESQVYLTLPDIIGLSATDRLLNYITPTEHPAPETAITIQGINYTVPRILNDFWKHGFAGLIDSKEKIKPCFWYGKQHPFEFEYIVGNSTAGYKQFTNLIIASNNVKPESFHYTIVGDSYDFSDQKPAMYWRQEATKAFYQYNGSDILYNHKVFDPVEGYLPEMVTSSDYIELDNHGNPLRRWETVSQTYRDTFLPWIYTRQDTFNEVEDFYKAIQAPEAHKDYPNITGGEIIWDSQFNQFSICNHVEARDMKEVGRTRGNIQYQNDKWTAQITPLNVINRNWTWFKATSSNGAETFLPKLVINNIPKELFNKAVNVEDMFPPELHQDQNPKYNLTRAGFSYKNAQSLDQTPWTNLACARKEVKLMDKYMKIRVRYPGDKLAIILATVTQFNTIG